MRYVALAMACVVLCGAFVPAMANPSVSVLAASSDSGGLLAWIADFIRWLFVPDSGYFQSQISRLSDKVNSKLGGLSYLYQMLQNFFQGLQHPGQAGLSMQVQPGYWFSGSGGVSVNLLGGAIPFVSMLRTVTTGLFAILTAMAGYKKLRSLFTAGEG